MSASAITDSSATSTSAPPTRAEEPQTRLPASPSATCQRCASAQFGRHQNGSSRDVPAAGLELDRKPAAPPAARRRSRAPRRGNSVQAGDCVGRAHGAGMVERRAMPDTQDDLLAVAHEAARAAARRADVALRSRPATASARRAVRPISCRRPTWRPSARCARCWRHGARDDTMIGEEEGAIQRRSELRWVVDPLDGTVNFLFGIPMFAVSVACEDAAGRGRRRRARPGPRRVLRGDALSAGATPER